MMRNKRNEMGERYGAGNMMRGILGLNGRQDEMKRGKESREAMKRL